MEKNFSIKEARELKQHSIEFVARKLNLQAWIVKNIEEGIKLSGIYSSYEISYTNAIHKFLEIPLIKTESNNLNNRDNNLQTLIIFYFIVFLFFTIVGLSHYIIKNFSQIYNISDSSYVEDDIIKLYSKETLDSNIKFIRHLSFMDSLRYAGLDKKNIFLSIQPKKNHEFFYKISYINENTQKLGTIGKVFNDKISPLTNFLFVFGL